MIHFFKKARKKFAATDRPFKYLSYAIGEIVLVVIGILIALQINNWNENRKLEKEELELLRGVKVNLETTLANFRADTIYNAKSILFYKRIQHYIEADLPYSNDLDSCFGNLTFWNSPFTITTSYKTLQTKGLDLIKNEKLRNKIVEMFEFEAVILIEYYDKSEWNINESISTPFFAKHIERLDGGSLDLARPNDFEKLKHDPEFTNLLSMLIRQRKKGIEYYTLAMVFIQDLINEIDMEVNSRI